MKLLVTGDWHPDVITMGVMRFDEIAAAAEAMADDAIREQVDVFCFLGDLADPDSGALTFRSIDLAMRIAIKLAEHDIGSIWLAGNHDVMEDGSGTTTLTPMRALELTFAHIHVVEQPRVIEIGSIAFVCLPFVCAAQAIDLDPFVTKVWPKTSPAVVLGHMTSIPGVSIGSETTDMPRGRGEAFPVQATTRAIARFNGHFHARQVSPDGIVMPGTPARLRFDEERHNPGYVLAEV